MIRKTPIYTGQRRRGERSPPKPDPKARAAPLRSLLRRRENPLPLAGAVLAAFAVAYLFQALTPAPRIFTQNDMDQAVSYTLDSLPPAPSPASLAYPIISPSVVRIRRLAPAPSDGSAAEPVETGTGTGVAIVDTGIILTSLHVVTGTDPIAVVFADGLEAGAVVISARPDRDLAVLRAETIPDDLAPATLGSSGGLRVGDRVAAVGFPFGLGPSLSTGVISALDRVFSSVTANDEAVRLIQFDAAANPGNSGGPLVNMDGEVVGIVTALYNPAGRGFFVGIGFAVPIEEAAAAAGESPF